jgi:hypothetical protein
MKKAILVTLLGLVTAPVMGGCGDDGVVEPEVCPEATPDENALAFPFTLYTGYNGRDTFVAPIVSTFGPKTALAADPGVVSVELTDWCNEGVLENGMRIGALLASTGPGNTVVTLSHDDVEKATNVVVTSYTLEEYDLGGERYNNPANPGGTRVACTACHGQPNGPDHTPMAVAFLPADVLLKIVKEGQYPNCLNVTDGTECDCTAGIPTCQVVPEENRVLSVAHSFELTPEEEVGIVAYLRGLPLKE